MRQTKYNNSAPFFDEIQSKLDDFISDPELKVIVGGDFNFVTDLDLDCFGGSPTEKESAKRVKDICLNWNLIDIWRIRNPGCKRFTWRQKNPLIQRRLDFWLISDSCQDEVEETDIKTAIRTDHSAITISFNSIESQKHGPSYWKFNASLIEDENYVTLMNQKIPEWIEEFEDVNDKRVLWDLVKYRVRQFSMKYCKEMARQRKADLSTIETELENCEDVCVTDPSVSNMEILEELQMKYDSHFDYLSKGAIIRSRATWYEKGEKNNKYLLGLESHRGKKGCIRKIFASSGHLTSDPKKNYDRSRTILL